MTPDVNVNHYYLKFISSIKQDIANYNKEISFLNTRKEKELEYIIENLDFYESKYNIKPLSFPFELIRKVYNSKEGLANKVNLYLNEETDSNSRVKLYKILNYCETLKKIHDYEEMINIAKDRTKIKFRQYQTLVTKYYNQVHKEVLQGFGYKFNFGIGTFCICRWELQETKKGKPKLDYDATRQAKKELLAKGKKLYNAREAQWYAARNIPYDGIDYRVYTKNTHIYDINIIKSTLFSYKGHKFEHAEHVGHKVRNKSYKQMADECKDLNDIVNYPVDIRYKLNMFLYKDPSNYILYIRNNEQNRFKYGAHNSKN